MYTDSDLNEAIRSGAMTPDAAEAFRGFMATSRSAPGADEESFRLLTGFNDVFVTIAIILVLVALNSLTLIILLPFWLLVSAPLTAAASWGLAEYFTRRRRMALPSIVLLLAFVGATYIAVSVAGTLASLGRANGIAEAIGSTKSAAALIGAAAAYAHWCRFRVPITVAVGGLAATMFIMSVAVWAVPALYQAHSLLVLVAGLGVFTAAMWWDASDRLRVTGRSDTAFWLHLLAAPMIVHPVFLNFGLLDAPIQPARALVAVACYALLAVVALTVDRRAVLISALAYVLWAMSSLLSGMGVLGKAFPLAALGIGSLLLVLSAFWQHARKLLLPHLPLWVQDRVPTA